MPAKVTVNVWPLERAAATAAAIEIAQIRSFVVLIGGKAARMASVAGEFKKSETPPNPRIHNPINLLIIRALQPSIDQDPLKQELG
jgi:hypothetical protein